MTQRIQSYFVHVAIVFKPNPSIKLTQNVSSFNIVQRMEIVKYAFIM